jgi:hypothetical protein
MSRKAPVQTFENYASHTPQKVNCIALPIPFIASPQLPKFYPPIFCRWTNFTAWKPSTMSNPQVQKFLIRCLKVFQNWPYCKIAQLTKKLRKNWMVE